MWNETNDDGQKQKHWVHLERMSMVAVLGVEVVGESWQRHGLSLRCRSMAAICEAAPKHQPRATCLTCWRDLACMDLWTARRTLMDINARGQLDN